MTKFSPGGIINKLIENSTIQDALVAQLDRVTGYEPVGRGFESLQARQTKRTLHLQCLFLLVRLPAQASRYALAFAGRDSRAKNVPLERFFDALHFKRARVWKTPGEQCFFCLVRLPTQAACCALAFVGCRKRAGGSFRSAVPLERFLTHSTSSARGRRAVCLFLWEIKLRRKRRRCLKQRLFCFGEGELEISFCTIQPPRGRKCGLLCSIFLIARLLLDAAILQNDDAVGVLEEIDAVGDGDDR